MSEKSCFKRDCGYFYYPTICKDCTSNSQAKSARFDLFYTTKIKNIDRRTLEENYKEYLERERDGIKQG